MQDDDKKHRDQFDASLPLPVSDASKSSRELPKKVEESTPAADLIRKKIEAAYQQEPAAKTEIKEVEAEKADGHKLSNHQKFIMELTNSGKPLHEIQMAWHEYYAALPDNQKHEVWNEFYKIQSQTAHHPAAQHAHQQAGSSKTQAKLPRELQPPGSRAGRSYKNFRNSFKPTDFEGVKVKPHSPLQSLVFGLGVGLLVIVIFMFSFFNERFITPFIQPSRTASATPLIISSQPVSQKPELIIPKINVQIPIIYASDNSDNTIETDLESGVVHYADTATPGQDGNLVIFGHSSNNIFNPGKYKFAFVLLKRLDNGDTFYIDNQGKRYTYEVFNKQVVAPSNVDVLGPVAGKAATATLITCDPPGTSINRLVISAEQIDPNPSTNQAASASSQKALTQTTHIASNGPTLWQRLVHWLWD